MSLLNSLWNAVKYQFPLKVLSVLISITLWVVVFGSRTIEITKEIPFEVVLAEDQIIVDPVPEKITFKVSGPKAFLRTLSNRLEDPIRANIKNLKTGTFTHRIYSDSIKLPLGVKVQSINPNVVQIKVEELKHKLISVQVITNGEVANGLKVLRTEVLPAQIKIKGPKNSLNSLTQIPTLPVDISSLKETTIIPLGFDFKAMGIDPDSSLPELNVEIQGKGQAFRVKHVPVKLKASAKAVMDDDEVTVIVRADSNGTDSTDSIKIEGDQIKAEVDVRDIPAGDYLKWIRVSLPEKVHLVRVIPPLTRVTVKGRE